MMLESEEQLLPERTKSRNILLSLLFSLLFPGLGQVYNGQFKKGIIFFCLLLLIPVLFGLFCGTTVFYGFLGYLLNVFFIRIYIIIDGIVVAKRQKDYVLKSYNTWYYYVLIAIVMLVVFRFYNTTWILGTRSLKTSTVSNAPNFQVGDYLIADMHAYNNHEPDYGDMVVFSGPAGHLFNFRVVGMPNDRIEWIDNMISVNGKLIMSTLTKENVRGNTEVKEFEQELSNGYKYLIYKNKVLIDSTNMNVESFVVPAQSYYLLVDNRDNSYDSRYIGFIKSEDIKGRILYRFWTDTYKESLYKDFTK